MRLEEVVIGGTTKLVEKRKNVNFCRSKEQLMLENAREKSMS